MPIQTAIDSISNNQGSPFGFKNRIINGGMVLDQRNAGASVTPNNSYTLDRWLGVNSQTAKFTIQQNAASVTPPAGFANYLGCTSTSAYSIAAGDYFNIQQYIEGYNIADLAWGTASAATITVSFWVRSSLTGTFGGALRNDPATRSYPFTYTISVANTWEQKSITIAGDTSGTWLTTNGRGITLSLGLGVGSTYSGTAGAWAAANYISATGATSVVGTSGATFYITGVQLEKGSTATSFDYRPYGTEFMLCQRYYQQLSATNSRGTFALGFAANTTVVTGSYFPPVQFRVYPSLASSSIAVDDSNGPVSATLAIGSTYGSLAAIGLNATATGLTQFRPYAICANNSTSAYVQLSAEL